MVVFMFPDMDGFDKSAVASQERIFESDGRYVFARADSN